MPLSGHLSTAITVRMVGGVPGLADIQPGFIQVLPAPITFTKMYGTLEVENGPTQLIVLTNTLLTLQAQLYKFDPVHGAFTAMPGASCTYQDASNPSNPTFTFLDPFLIEGLRGVCSNTAFSASFNAGDVGFILISASATPTGIESQLAVSPILIDAAIGLSQ